MILIIIEKMHAHVHRKDQNPEGRYNIRSVSVISIYLKYLLYQNIGKSLISTSLVYVTVDAKISHL